MKEVVSGDTVVVVGATAGPAVPPEKRLTLSSLVAPRLVSFGSLITGGWFHLQMARFLCYFLPLQGKRDGSTRDEPFAWEAREFLRKKLIGQVIWSVWQYCLQAVITSFCCLCELVMN